MTAACPAAHTLQRLWQAGPRRCVSRHNCCAGLAWHLFRVTVRKDEAVRCGNWEQLPLTAAQQKYAATDAYAALKLYEVCAAFSQTHWPSAEPCIAGDACPDLKL